ncbi:unnamed protein product [Parnassius apollo]|uniref:(apollo) hypothetical protein n=2 Tax=Parnassius apollo TaxID=110799 RepID=A0A8S3VYC6_PARAO|nr:unnamed protein product [Parnassius apollo]
MFMCHRCNSEARDGVQCTMCLNRFDFPCAGITEAGYRKLGDRKATWKCNTCKTGTASPNLSSEKTVQGRVPSYGDLENIRLELSKITKQISSLPQLIASVKTIQADISDLKDMKSEMMDVKNSLNHVHTSVEGLTNKLTEIDREIQSLQKTKDDVVRVEHRLEKLEAAVRENQQRSRLNNIEIKGVPVTSSENLFTIISNIGSKIGYEVPKEQINYVARVPQRNNKNTKNIIVSLHTRYLRDNFIAAAKKCKTLTAADLGLRSDSRIFVNDHLTFENKQLLNKTKALAREKNFSYTWVKNCTILMKKNATSPTYAIKTEADLKKIF